MYLTAFSFQINTASTYLFFFQPMGGKGNCTIVPREVTGIGGVEKNSGPITTLWRWNSWHHDETLSPSSFQITSYPRFKYISNRLHTCLFARVIIHCSERIKSATLWELFNNHIPTLYYYPILCSLKGTLLVAQLVEALRFKSEGRALDSRWCHWNFWVT